MDCEVASYHVESYNYMADEGIQLAALDVPKIKFKLPSGDAVEFSYANARLGYPVTSEGTNKLFPSVCRQIGLPYRAPLHATIDFTLNGKKLDSVESAIGEVPVMLMSNRCNLRGMSREELVRKGEEPVEHGGYFISSGGGEKVVRLLVANKRNFPFAMQRRSARDKGKMFSEFYIMMRCVRGNHRVSLNNLHYLENDTLVLSLGYRRELYYIPLMYVLKCMTSMNDAKIHEHMTYLRPGDNAWADCVTNMLGMAKYEQVISQQDALKALGSRLRVVLGNVVAPWEDDEEVGRFLIRYCVAIHLDSEEQKFHCLVLMALKLFALVKGEILPESLDNPQFQEASVSGHILLLLLRDRLEVTLMDARRKLEKYIATKKENYMPTNKDFARALTPSKTGSDISRRLDHFLATGNVTSLTGLGLMQTNGFSVSAERINYLRFISHFRAIHRGAFFTEMRTTDVRKLRPEAWGFICPVHTPDGSPCGLLNHVTASCRVVTHCASVKKLVALLVGLGMIPHGETGMIKTDELYLYPVVIDGDFVGYLPAGRGIPAERQLRATKIDPADDRVPSTAEVTFIQRSFDISAMSTQFPGLYIYTVAGRLYRPVYNIPFDTVEFISPFEQVYLSIAVTEAEIQPGVTMHREIHPSAFFSFTANLIPFPDHNQSPRNVYQCQMGKQTMGVPVHAWNNRVDNKMYLLRYPQRPLVKTKAYDLYDIDEYPLGTNACVCVISYTGYDMEDAMVINRGSFQRGFGHGSVIKVERIALVEKRGFQQLSSRVFYADPQNRPSTVDADGLPITGRLYREGDVYYSTFDQLAGAFQNHKFDHKEPAYCGLVRIVADSASDGKVHALIQWRIPRNPIIGDKFASRHGQKGINSFLWPAESMPFSETGMMPDILFNPHGFPSRMTIGMMIESMAGKAASVYACEQDASPFVFGEENTAVEHFGNQLTDAGFNYLGNETLYSGIDGRELEVQVFFGVVYYQRLRHMIDDKFQVRSDGPIDPVTMQPVKGRKRGGGIRFGEMERDALIAHGANFCLQDRLFNCSDRDEVYVCARCRSIMSVTMLKSSRAMLRRVETSDNRQEVLKERDYHSYTRRHCTACKSHQDVYAARVPRILRYLSAELSSVNVKLQLGVAHPSEIRR